LHYQQTGLGGELRIAPYDTFGTPELAEVVLSALEGKQPRSWRTTTQSRSGRA
jgi:L-fuculose-phosphate aldolase